MTQNESPQGVTSALGAGEDASLHANDTTSLGALVAQLLARVDSLEREVKRLKRQQAQAYDWSAEVPREMREVG